MANVDFRRYKRIVQLFWDPEPKNDDISGASIWCLGKNFAPGAQLNDLPDDSRSITRTGQRLAQKSFDTDSQVNSASKHQGAIEVDSHGKDDNGGWPSEFLDDFESRLWFTYRSNFPPIKKSTNPTTSPALSLSVRFRSQISDQGGFTTDTGWGCMIRSGQCLLGNALGILRYGRDYKYRARIEDEWCLLALFADDPKAPFSIHKFVEHGASACGKHPGEWFGPSATASCIQALCQETIPNELRVYLTRDGADVYEDSLLKLAKADDHTFHPVLVLVGIRLGIDRVTPVYWEALKQALRLPQSIGIAGGRPSSSHYFMGVQGDNFFYLDPHHPRPALAFHSDSSGYSVEDISSFHTRRLRRLHIKDMDPSMLIAFLIRDEADWRDWKSSIIKTQGKLVVHVADIEPVLHGHAAERQSAVDDVEALDDDQDEANEDHDERDGELIERPEM